MGGEREFGTEKHSVEMSDRAKLKTVSERRAP